MHPATLEIGASSYRHWTPWLSAVALACGSSHQNASDSGVGGASLVDASTSTDAASGGTTASNTTSGGTGVVLSSAASGSLTSTGSISSTGGARQIIGWDDQLRLPEAQDTNSDPNVFETDIEAKLASTECSRAPRRRCGPTTVRSRDH